MKTELYNPSPLKVELKNSFLIIREKLNYKMSSIDTIDIKSEWELDNPMIHMTTKDQDGEVQEFVIKVTQRPDKH